VVAGAPAYNTWKGAVFTFTRASAAAPWVPMDPFPVTEGTHGSTQLGGLSIALAGGGTVLAASAEPEGEVMVYRLVAGAWALEATLAGASPNWGFGTSVCLSADGEELITGEYDYGSSYGIMRHFRHAGGGVWNEVASYDDTSALYWANDAIGPQVGWSFACSDDLSTVVAGAPAYNTWKGAVFTFTRASAAAPFVLDAAPAEDESPYSDPNDGLGFRVALTADGLTMAANAYGSATDESGRVLVFTRAGGAWVFTSFASPDGRPPGDLSGVVQTESYWGTDVAFSRDGAALVATLAERRPITGTKAAAAYLVPAGAGGTYAGGGVRLALPGSGDAASYALPVAGVNANASVVVLGERACCEGSSAEGRFAVYDSTPAA